MKKIIKTTLTVLFIFVSAFSIYSLIIDYSADGLIFTVLAFTLFFIHLFAWFAPKKFFNLCWKITNIMPDSFDYDTSFNKLENGDIGILITSVILIGISLLF